VRCAVVVPVKRFSAAKARLAPVLSADQRARVARTMATIVVRAASPLPAYVVCDDDEVAEWARSLGAEVLWRPGHGLNGAVRSALDGLHQVGIERAIVAHGDLPLATSLAWLSGPTDVTIVPDRHDDGTNVISLPTGVPFEFGYGGGSFRRHATQALAASMTLRVVRDQALGWDVDLPDDLARVESWISPDSRA
jgi:2-phospho-L-lactate guanylyltransferase